VIEAALGLGLAASLAFSEALGLAAGGMLAPGYLALELQHPLRAAVTLLCGVLAYALVRGASRLALIYGRRRTAAMILIGVLLRYAAEGLLGAHVPPMPEVLALVAYVVPGLLAIWMARQGVVQTACAAVMAAVAVRLCLLLLAGWGVLS